MLILNFAYPFTPEQLTAIEKITGESSLRVIDCPVRSFDNQQPFEGQVEALLERLELSPSDWQPPVLVNLPSLASIAALVLAKVHGRLGHFPAIIRLRPVEGAAVTKYEVAEIVNLEAVRQEARGERN